jgi:predicted ribosome quality control (RQC) complex YloA/Tae2 family protein
MQPFDALTIRAVLCEAKPLLLNRRVDKVYQIGRDEILLCLRAKAGMCNLLLSAQTAFGRLCLVKENRAAQGEKNNNHRNQSNFCTLLRKHLSSATLIAIEQPLGERTVDFAFSCQDEVGSTSVKVLTAEIMGRHSNLIFWDKASTKIVSASHVVTKEMSRQREIAPGLRFERPPGQDKPNIFSLSKETFATSIDALRQMAKNQPPAETALAAASLPATIEQWLINTNTGLGRHLSEELVSAAQLPSPTAQAIEHDDLLERLWQQIERVQTTAVYKPAMRNDLSRYSVLSLVAALETSPEWKHFPSVNDMIDEYYRAVEMREQFNQLRERLRAELKGESDRLESRITAASAQMGDRINLTDLKKCGDLILANLQVIAPGQESFVCEDLFDEHGEKFTIKLNPNMTPSQNAQSFYRQYAKTRTRQSAAKVASDEANARLSVLRGHLGQIESAKSSDELRRLRETWLGRKPQDTAKTQPSIGKKKNKSRLLSVTSSDGWTIYVGRNRQENDHLLSRMAQPSDIWLHILGQGGAHVLIKVPASKQDPPLTTLKEAAQVAARLSKAATGTKVRVVYTQCRYVKKIAKEKPGVVRYENERTLEIDTAQPMPQCMKQLFQH